jgi:hypothetical protein
MTPADRFTDMRVSQVPDGFAWSVHGVALSGGWCHLGGGVAPTMGAAITDALEWMGGES